MLYHMQMHRYQRSTHRTVQSLNYSSTIWHYFLVLISTVAHRDRTEQFHK